MLQFVSEDLDTPMQFTMKTVLASETPLRKNCPPPSAYLLTPGVLIISVSWNLFTSTILTHYQSSHHLYELLHHLRDIACVLTKCKVVNFFTSIPQSIKVQ